MKIEYVPYFLELKDKLEENEMLVYGFMALYFKFYKNGFCLTNSKISQILNIEEKKVSQTIKKLETKKMIKECRLLKNEKYIRQIILISDKNSSYDA